MFGLLTYILYLFFKIFLRIPFGRFVLRFLSLTLFLGFRVLVWERFWLPVIIIGSQVAG